MLQHAIIQWNHPLESTQVKIPEPQGRQVLIRTLASGVCHSDLHLVEGGHYLGRGRSSRLADRGIKLPIVPGHEVVGVVDSVGDSVRDVEVGQRVLAYPWIGCGQCASCRSGREHLCSNQQCLGVQTPGGYAEYVLVPDEKYLIKIGELRAESMAPLACAGLTAYSAVRKIFHPNGHDHADEHDPSVVIIGAGGLGLMAVNIILGLGKAAPVVLDIKEDSLLAARQAGAGLCLNIQNPTQLQADIAAFLGGSKPDAIIDFVGNEETSAIGFDLLGRGGKLVTVGLFGGEAPWPLPFIATKAATIYGSYVGSLHELHELVELVKQERIALPPVTTWPLAQAQAALEQLRQGKVRGRAVLTNATESSAQA